MPSSAWDLLGNSFAIVLFFGPAFFLTLRYLKGPRFPWWLLIGLSLVIGWACTIGASYSTSMELSNEIRDYEERGENVPEQLMEDWASDAHAMFALMFGWAFAAFNLCLWLIVYAIIIGILKLIRKTASTRAKA